MDDALRALRLGSASERIAAARLVAGTATKANVSELDRIRRRELDHYVQQAIDEAIMAARTRPAAVPRPDGPPWEVADAATQLDEEMYALALGATTKSFVHELRPSIGLARLALSHRDLASAVGHVERMDRLLDAMERPITQLTVPVASRLPTPRSSTLKDTVAPLS